METATYTGFLTDPPEQPRSALEDRMLIGPDNREVSQASLSPQAKQVLHDYRFIQ